MNTTIHPTPSRLRPITFLALLLGAITVAGIARDAQGQGLNPNPAVVPPDDSFRGRTYGEWGARWWQAAFSIPVEDGNHPLFSGGAFAEDNKVVFLAAVGGGTTLNVTIAPGTALFLPVINAECSVLEPDPFHGDDEAELRACANGHMDNTSGRFAVIDGVPVSNLDSYRVESPLFQFGPLPEDNLFEFSGLDAPAGTISPAVDAGFYLLLTPLTVGTHTVRVGGTADLLGFSIDTTFNITVAPPKRAPQTRGLIGLP